MHLLEEHKKSVIAELVKNPPAMQETQVQFLGQEDVLEDRLPTSVFWPGEFHGLYRIGHKESDKKEQLSFHFKESVGGEEGEEENMKPMKGNNKAYDGSFYVSSWLA